MTITPFAASPRRRHVPAFEPALVPADTPIIDLPGDTYPPYNIERYDADHYRIVLGVAGYEPDELELYEEGTDLVVRGDAGALRSNAEAIRRLIEPHFERRFRLLNGFRLDESELRNGLLIIDIARDPAVPAVSARPLPELETTAVAGAA